LKDLYRKLECITLNDFYSNVGDNENTGSCCKSGNFLSDWEYEQKIKLLKDYMHFTKNKDYIRQEMLEEEELLEEEEYHYGEYDDELPF
jgi:hypothetical protein